MFVVLQEQACQPRRAAVFRCLTGWWEALSTGTPGLNAGMVYDVGKLNTRGESNESTFDIGLLLGWPIFELGNP